ncbi:hypothetical protein AB6A40_000802 [Gnathostoma spinigerum]|uniref:Uncharacterized protein n=1 Tax=Gnathostoma spinigerum TaxID=75299 RepID=A0ABD6E2S3_9BILA
MSDEKKTASQNVPIATSEDLDVEMTGDGTVKESYAEEIQQTVLLTGPTITTERIVTSYEVPYDDQNIHDHSMTEVSSMVTRHITANSSNSSRFETVGLDGSTHTGTNLSSTPTRTGVTNAKGESWQSCTTTYTTVTPSGETVTAEYRQLNSAGSDGIKANEQLSGGVASHIDSGNPQPPKVSSEFYRTYVSSSTVEVGGSSGPSSQITAASSNGFATSSSRAGADQSAVYIESGTTSPVPPARAAASPSGVTAADTHWTSLSRSSPASSGRGAIASLGFDAKSDKEHQQPTSTPQTQHSDVTSTYSPSGIGSTPRRDGSVHIVTTTRSGEFIVTSEGVDGGATSSVVTPQRPFRRSDHRIPTARSPISVTSHVSSHTTDKDIFDAETQRYSANDTTQETEQSSAKADSSLGTTPRNFYDRPSKIYAESVTPSPDVSHTKPKPSSPRDRPAVAPKSPAVIAAARNVKSEQQSSDRMQSAEPFVNTELVRTPRSVEDKTKLSPKVPSPRSISTTPTGPAIGKFGSQVHTADELDEKRRNQLYYDYACRILEVRNWMGECIKKGNDRLRGTIEYEENFKMPEVDVFVDSLRNGVLLARLANFFAPDIVPANKIYDIHQTSFGQNNKAVYYHVDNIKQWRDAVETVNVPKTLIPETTDIYNGRNTIQTVFCLYALARHLFSLRRGPPLRRETGIKFQPEVYKKIEESVNDERNVELPRFEKVSEIISNEPSNISEEAKIIKDLSNSLDSQEKLLLYLVDRRIGILFVQEQLIAQYQIKLIEIRRQLKSGEHLTKQQIQMAIDQVNESDAIQRLNMFIEMQSHNPSVSSDVLTIMDDFIHHVDLIQRAAPVYIRALSDTRNIQKTPLTADQVRGIVDGVHACAAVKFGIQQNDSDRLYQSLTNPVLRLENLLDPACKKAYLEVLKSEYNGRDSEYIMLPDEIQQILFKYQEKSKSKEVDESVIVNSIKNASHMGDTESLLRIVRKINIASFSESYISFYASALRARRFESIADVVRIINETNDAVEKAAERARHVIDLNRSLLHKNKVEARRALERGWRDLIQVDLMDKYFMILEEELSERRRALGKSPPSWSVRRPTRLGSRAGTGDDVHRLCRATELEESPLAFSTPDATNSVSIEVIGVKGRTNFSPTVNYSGGMDDETQVQLSSKLEKRTDIEDSRGSTSSRNLEPKSQEVEEDLGANSRTMQAESASVDRLNDELGCIIQQFDHGLLYVSADDYKIETSTPKNVNQWLLRDGNIKETLKKVNDSRDKKTSEAKTSVLTSVEKKENDAARKIQGYYRDYRKRCFFDELRSSRAPSLNVVRWYVRRLLKTPEDKREEEAIRQSKVNKTKLINCKRQLEDDLKRLDYEIMLCVKNRMSLTNLTRGRSKRMTPVSPNDQSLSPKAGSDKNAFEIIAFHMQRNPRFLARIVKKYSESTEADHRERLENFVKDALLPTFNFGAEMREEFLLVEFYRFIIEQQVEKLSYPDQLKNTVIVMLMQWMLRDIHRIPNNIEKRIADLNAEMMKDKNNREVFNIQPMEIYETLKGKKAANVTEAAEDPNVMKFLEESKSYVAKWSEKFARVLFDPKEPIPNVVRYLVRSTYRNMKKKFPHEVEKELIQALVGMVYKCYWEPMIVVKLVVELDSRQEHYRAIIAELIGSAVSNAGYGDDKWYLKSLNSTLIATHHLAVSLIEKLVRDETPIYSHNRYTDYLSPLGKPLLYIRIKQLRKLDEALRANIDVIFTKSDDRLANLVKTASLSDFDEETTVRLELHDFPETGNIEEITDAQELLDWTKRYIVECLLCNCQGDNLPEMLNRSTTQTEENLFKTNFPAEKKSLNERKLMIKDYLERLEVLDWAKAADDYQSVVNSIAKDIIEEQDYRSNRRRQLNKMFHDEEELQKTVDALKERIKVYQEYLQRVLENQPTAPRHPSIEGSTSKAKKLIDKRHSRDVKHRQVEISARKLDEKGILVSVDGYTKLEEYDKLSFKIVKTEQHGIYSFFIIEPKKQPVSYEIVFQDLLSARDNEKRIVKIGNRINFDSNKFIEFLNKEFNQS